MVYSKRSGKAVPIQGFLNAPIQKEDHERSGPCDDGLAATGSHVPNNGEQMVRYYGYYSIVSRGEWKMREEDELIPSVLELDNSSKGRRKNWARLIQMISEVNPLTCPKCFGLMKVISVIEDEDVIKKSLKHLGLWDQKARPPPKATGPPKIVEYSIDYSTSQFPVPARRLSGGSNKWPSYQSAGQVYVDSEPAYT